MKQNNKGFSLVELIIAMSILAVVGLALGSFLINGANAYNRSSDEVNLQYEQQLVVNQIRDLILESSEGLYFDATSEVLTIYGTPTQENGNKNYPVSFVAYRPNPKVAGATEKTQLRITSKNYTDPTAVAYSAADESDLLAEYVTAFSVDLSKVNEKKVSFSITFEIDGRVRTVNETVALRNQVVASDDAGDIWDDDQLAVESFIQGISISRGLTEFTNGDTDVLGKMGSFVEVTYNATVKSNEVSQRDYAVSWSLVHVNQEGSPENGAINTGISMTTNGTSATIKVDATTPTGTQVELYATSVDDPLKYGYINIRVEDDGIYADHVNVNLGNVNEGVEGAEAAEVRMGNGFVEYRLVPTLYFTDGSFTSDLRFFTWNITTTPVPETEDPGTEEPGTEEETPQPIVLPEGCYFKESTGLLHLTENANGSTITITATAKEKNYQGQTLSGQFVLNVNGIEPYDPETALQIVATNTMARGAYQPVSLQVLNAPEGAEYTYNIQVSPYEGEDAGTEWGGGAKNSSIDLLSFIDVEKTEYDAEHVSHEEDLEETDTIRLACAKELNWSYDFKAVLNATAMDQNGNILEAKEYVITIPAVKVYMAPTATVPQEVDTRPVYTDSILRYEDWYFNDPKPTGTLAKYCTTRRWFEVSFENLEMDDEDWQTYTLTNNYMFMNQIGLHLNDKIVPYPDSKPMFDRRLTGFEVRLRNWERLANRPVFMNFSVTIKDDKGNSQASEAMQYAIIYELFPKEETETAN